MIPKKIYKKLAVLLPEDLINTSKYIEASRGEFLFRPGDSVDFVYYIIEGQLRALRYQFDGKAAVMMNSTAGNFFAPVSVNMESYPCAAVAGKKTGLLKIPKQQLQNHLKIHPEFALQFIHAISLDLKQQCSNAERLRIKSARERIIHFITCESPCGKKINLKYPLITWADELGIEPESLYRTLAEMEKEKLISRDKKNIEILS